MKVMEKSDLFVQEVTVSCDFYSAFKTGPSRDGRLVQLGQLTIVNGTIYDLMLVGYFSTLV